MKEELNFISLAEAAKITNYSQDYISLLCRQGKLKAQKLGRNWVTTKEWVYSYVDNSNGGGASIVPIKVVKKEDIINNNKEEASKAEESIEEEHVDVQENVNNKEAKKDSFYGKSALEFAVYCFFSIIIVCNIYAFNSYVKDEKESSVMTNNYYSDHLGRVAGASTQKIEDNSEKNNSYEIVENSHDLSIEQQILLEEIEARFSNEVELVELYGSYAILRYKEDPKNKFLYISEKAK